MAQLYHKNTERDEMIFIRIAGLLAGIALVVAVALLPGKERVTSLFKQASPRVAAFLSLQADAVPESAAHAAAQAPDTDRTASPDTAPPPECQPLTAEHGIGTETGSEPDNATGAAPERPALMMAASSGSGCDNATDAEPSLSWIKNESEAPSGHKCYIWESFNTRSRAEGFARHMGALCDVACMVERQGAGYHIYFTYHEAPERDRVIACMQERSGIIMNAAGGDRGYAD